MQQYSIVSERTWIFVPLIRHWNFPVYFISNLVPDNIIKRFNTTNTKTLFGHHVVSVEAGSYPHRPPPMIHVNNVLLGLLSGYFSRNFLNRIAYAFLLECTGILLGTIPYVIWGSHSSADENTVLLRYSAVSAGMIHSHRPLYVCVCVCVCACVRI
jgi:hypothetical protein